MEANVVDEAGGGRAGRRTRRPCSTCRVRRGGYLVNDGNEWTLRKCSSLCALSGTVGSAVVLPPSFRRFRRGLGTVNCGA